MQGKQYTGSLGFKSRFRHCQWVSGLLILSLVIPACGDSKIYEWHDAKGTEHYSDTFTVNAKVVDIKPGYEFFSVKKVYDGDTVQLDDGRKIRLLGINTPEIQHRDKQAEAGGQEAKDWLLGKILHKRVRLEFDTEKTDKYGRTLAYLFTENNELINLSLVRQGLATLSIYPPNLLYVNELMAAQEEAEKDKVGLWALADYAVIPVSRLTEAGHIGWTRLSGKITDIHTTARFIYLIFSNQMDARIECQWLSLFPDVNSYLGKTLEVRGWLNRKEKHFSVLIRHPSAIKVLTGLQSAN